MLTKPICLQILFLALRNIHRTHKKKVQIYEGTPTIKIIKTEIFLQPLWDYLEEWFYTSYSQFVNILEVSLCHVQH